MYRERLTITLDSELLMALDSLIDGEQLRNRSQTIEYLLKEGMGLHALSSAFVFVNETTNPAWLSSLATSLASLPLTLIYLCMPLAMKEQATTYSALFTSPVEILPADFGSGGAVSLKKADLIQPFIMAWPSPQPLPASLVAAYLFHRSHHDPLTELCTSSETGHTSSGIYLASPEIATFLPAGTSDLQRDTFPALLKAARVKGYFY